MKVAIIPARGGSKRIPGKNIKNFLGKPMIAWSIEIAISSGIFDRIIVSTDSVEIAEVAKKYGADIPFLRPANLADDYSGTTEVIGHACEWLLNNQLHVSAACCIYATAPFLSVDDLLAGYELFESGNWGYVFSATEFSAPIFRSFKKGPSEGVEMFFPEEFNTRSQDLPVALHDAGQFYWGSPNSWITGLKIFDKHSSIIEIPSWRVQDIDTLDDWRRAELIADLIVRD